MPRLTIMTAVLILALSGMISRVCAQETPTLAGRLERCQTDLTNCQAQNANEDLKRERESLLTQSQQLQQNITILNSGVFNTAGALAAQNVIQSLKPAKNRISCIGKNGTSQIVTNLVIGLLKVEIPPNIAPGGPPRTLTVEFEPRSLGAFRDNEVIHWYLRCEYDPKNPLRAAYDLAQSGNKEQRRELSLSGNRSETWIWQITADEDLNDDTPATDVMGFLSYTLGDSRNSTQLLDQRPGAEGEAWREPIKWTMAPGLLSAAWTWAKSSLIVIISCFGTVLSTLLAWYNWSRRKQAGGP